MNQATKESASAELAEFEVFWKAECERTWRSGLLPAEHGAPVPQHWGDGLKRQTFIGWQAARATPRAESAEAVCSCPSGDGSLRWPCLAHPPKSADYAELRRIAAAATPGPWEWWTSNSVLRLTGGDGKDGGVLYAYSHKGHADVTCSAENRAFIATFNPAKVLAMIDRLEELEGAIK